MANRFKVDCRKYPSDKGCTVAITGALEEVVELGWLHAKMHHAHKDEEEKGIKDWMRSNAESGKRLAKSAREARRVTFTKRSPRTLRGYEVGHG